MENENGKITITTSHQENNIHIFFEDNGEGMTEDTKSKLFDPFFTTKGVEGKGLGLSIAYGILNEHNGKVEIESTLQKGTKIELIIPIT